VARKENQVSTRIGFSTGKHSPVSAIIRAATKSTVSHAYVIYDDPVLGDEYILEADIGGFQPDRYSIFKRSNTVVQEVEVDLPLDRALKTADQWVGVVDYNYSGLFGVEVYKLERWLHMKAKNPLDRPHSMFCSQAMVRLLTEAAQLVPTSPMANPLMGLTPDVTSPQDLLTFLTSFEGTCTKLLLAQG
jgi:hypothetical protein